jgi:pyrroloquinoline quinone (PQQ) biosynthesis protein C
LGQSPKRSNLRYLNQIPFRDALKARMENCGMKNRAPFKEGNHITTKQRFAKPVGVVQKDAKGKPFS